MSSYVFQFFCGDGKVGTRGSGQQGREMLSLQAPPPRPRPSSAPMRPPHSSGEHNESRFQQPVPRDRRRRAHSRSVSTDTAGHDLPVEDGVEPLQKDVRNKRDPVPRRAIGTQPRLRCFRHHGLFYLTSTTCRLLGKSICTLRQDGFQRICNGQLRLFHRTHNRSSLKGQRMFNRSSDHQCRAAKRPSLTRANRLCH